MKKTGQFYSLNRLTKRLTTFNDIYDTFLNYSKGVDT
jgi:hypothetical protein